MRDLILKLHEIGAVQFGDFQLKSGIHSPFYIDLRLMISYPTLLRTVSEELWKLIAPLKTDLICGVPLAAVPMATAISLINQIPMIMRRKEVKNHGTKKSIEGVYESGQDCVIVEDLVTSGVSILETVEVLQQEGLVVNNAIVLIDRLQGGKENLETRGIDLHAVMTIRDVVTFLMEEGIVDNTTAKNVCNFIRQNSKVTVES